MGTWNCEGSTKPATNMRVALIIAAAICIAFVAAETTVEQEDVVPETTLTQNEESFGLRRHIKRIRFSYCRWKAKRCHKHVAKKTAHLKKAAHAHARAGKHAAKVAKAHAKASKAARAKAHAHIKRARGHGKVAGRHYRIAKYHHKKAGRWWRFWLSLRHKKKAAAARKKAHAHLRARNAHVNAAKHAAKKSGAHKKVAKHAAKKARKHFHIAKKLMAYVRAQHKKCGMGFVRCMKSRRRIRIRRRI